MPTCSRAQNSNDTQKLKSMSAYVMVLHFYTAVVQQDSTRVGGEGHEMQDAGTCLVSPFLRAHTEHMEHADGKRSKQSLLRCHACCVVCNTKPVDPSSCVTRCSCWQVWNILYCGQFMLWRMLWNMLWGVTLCSMVCNSRA